MNSHPVIVSGAFNDLRSPQIRFLQEAAKLGPVSVLLWSDDCARQFADKPPQFPQAERLYFLQSIRFVERVQLVDHPPELAGLPQLTGSVDGVWVVAEGESESGVTPVTAGWRKIVVTRESLRGFPEINPVLLPTSSPRKKVVVTGCYDWFHSGHARFFEEASAFGDLYVIVGHDANIRLLKGSGHPLYSQDERRYVAGSIRYVTQAIVSTGEGWLDADPEIRRLRPDIYVVNEDGDKGGKREYCQQRGIEYQVLKRVPAPGLPARSSTHLRGF
jgi:cytidyltransferase-like protein